MAAVVARAGESISGVRPLRTGRPHAARAPPVTRGMGCVGVLSRVVTFTLSEDWEDDTSPRGQKLKRSRVHGEIEQFVEYIRSEFPEWVEPRLGVDDPPYTYLEQYD